MTLLLNSTHLKIQSSNVLLSQFMRNSKAVGVLWGIFTVCYTVLIIVVFLQVSLSPCQYILDSGEYLMFNRYLLNHSMHRNKFIDNL